MMLDGLSPIDCTKQLYNFYNKQLELYGRKGLFGVAQFSEVFDTLIPIQQEKLRSICGNRFRELFSEGSIVSVAIAYEEDIISKINTMSGQGPDIVNWNIYALEYDNINSILNAISMRMANNVDGIAIPATWDSQDTKQFSHISETFGSTVSHRAVAEIAGLGWRGKNGLVINEKFSCAIRFASIIIPFTLSYNQPNTMSCGECTACEDACSFIRNRSILSDYRDYCLRYINYLKSNGLKFSVCGKCIKACVYDSVYSNQFEL